MKTQSFYAPPQQIEKQLKDFFTQTGINSSNFSSLVKFIHSYPFVLQNSLFVSIRIMYSESGQQGTDLKAKIFCGPPQQVDREILTYFTQTGINSSNFNSLVKFIQRFPAVIQNSLFEVISIIHA